MRSIVRPMTRSSRLARPLIRTSQRQRGTLSRRHESRRQRYERSDRRTFSSSSGSWSGSSSGQEPELWIASGLLVGVGVGILYRYAKHVTSDDGTFRNSTMFSSAGVLAEESGSVKPLTQVLYRLDETPSDKSVKPPVVVRLLENALRNNRLMRYLDEEQRANMIEFSERIEVNPGDVIMREGDKSGEFYMIFEGEMDVLHSSGTGRDGPSVLAAKLCSGTGFGEQGCLLGTTRSATVVASTKSVLYKVNAATISQKVLPSEAMKRLYKDGSSMLKDNGEPIMTVSDFVRSVAPSADEQEARRLRYVFGVVDREQRGFVDFAEFAVFYSLMSKADADYEIAFLLFDHDRDGVISFDELRGAIDFGTNDKSFKFNYECNLMTRFFGRKRDRKLRYDEFTQLFSNLQEEFARQLFEFYDESESGRLSSSDFLNVVDTLGTWRVPPMLRHRVHQLQGLRHGTTRVSYPEFVAFNFMLNHAPSFGPLLKRACDEMNGPITRNEFKRYAPALSGANITPMEVNIIFHIFDLDRDGKIDFVDYKAIMGDSFDERRPIPQEKVSVSEARQPSRLLDSAKNFSVGALAGGLGATVVYPIDLVKTRMQNQRVVAGTEKMYKNSLDCFLKTIRSEGALGLYRGLGPQLIGVAPEKAIKLTVNDLLRGMFEDERKVVSFPLEVLAGSCAGASQVIFTNPIEIVKIRLQIQGEQMVKGALPTGVSAKGAVSIVHELGIAGLYRGAGACLLRDVPFSGIYFPAYAALKRTFADENGHNSPFDLLLAGTLAGAPAASLVTPADVIKTRLQVEVRQGQTNYKNIRHCAATILKEEGISAFFKGAGARMLRSCPQFGVTLWSYEILKAFLTPDLPSYAPTNAPLSTSDRRALSQEDVTPKILSLHERLDILQGTRGVRPGAEAEYEV